jgi:hypothetical protein
VESVLDIRGDRKIFGKVRRREVVAEQTLEKLRAKLAQKNEVLGDPKGDAPPHTHDALIRSSTM